MGNAWMPPQSGCTRACIAQGAGYPRERLHIDGTEKRGGFVLPRCIGRGRVTSSCLSVANVDSSSAHVICVRVEYFPIASGKRESEFPDLR